MSLKRTWQSDAFGQGAPNTDPDQDGKKVHIPLRFPGQIASEGGLYYNYFRDYEPATGRYVQSDPIGLQGGLNTFGYVDGNPLIFVDPKGLAAQAVCLIPPVGVACAGAAQVLVNGVAVAIGVGTLASGASSDARPKGMSPLEERQFDRHCANTDDPCGNLKAAAQKAITMARQKMNNLLVDKGNLFGTNGWATHVNDLKGRLASISAMISLGRMMGCDMSQEAAAAASIFIPRSPR